MRLRPEALGGRSQGSTAVDHAARLGLLAYGVVHLLIAGIAFQLALGDDSRSASSQGAFAVLAQDSLGKLSLLLISGGMLALVVWQVLELFSQHSEDAAWKRAGKRAASGGRAVVYAALGYNAGSLAAGESGGSGGSKDHATAELMSAPGGQVLVAGVGAAVIAVAGGLAFTGVTARFRKHLDSDATSQRRRSPILLLGRVGYVGKGLAFGAVGTLFVVAAVQHDPKEAGGLDIALEELLRQPLGPALVAGVAASMACFGLYCFAWSRHLDR